MSLFIRRKAPSLTGLSRTEVEQRYGHEFNDRHSDVWSYQLGTAFPMRKVVLFVIFKGEKVVRTEIRSFFGKVRFR